jgi:hypothetical protein
MEEDLQNKQAYLRENVLEKGYDADEFMEFLQEKKGENGLDLNTWTYLTIFPLFYHPLFFHSKGDNRDPLRPHSWFCYLVIVFSSK